MSVHVSGGSKLNAYFNKIKNANQTQLRVGFLTPAMAKIAVINEFGINYPVTPKVRAWFQSQGINLKSTTTHIHIPARPFMQRTIDVNRQKWQDNIPLIMKKADYDFTKIMELLGEFVSADITEMIEEGEFVENSPLTIKLKNGRGKPLVNTGKMANSVSFEVE
jgi:hypothetical protein